MQAPESPGLSPERQRSRRAQVVQGYSQLRRAQRRRRRLAVTVVASALLLIGSLGVAAYAQLRPGRLTTLQSGVGCFEGASLRADVAVVDLKGMDPIQRCRQVWVDGGLRRGGVNAILDKVFGRQRSAPPLVACVYPSGALAVLPGRDAATCGRLGLRQPGPGELARLQRFDAFKQAVIDRWFAHSECVDPRAARTGIERLLETYALDGWRVVTLDEIEPGAGKFDRDRPCALLDFRSDQRLVVLTPDARPKGG